MVRKSPLAALIVLAACAQPVPPHFSEEKKAMCREIVRTLPGQRAGDTRDTQREVAKHYDLVMSPELCGGGASGEF